MEGTGEEQLLEAMRFLLSPDRTRELLVQWTKADIILVLPFNSRVLWVERISGDPAAQSRLLQRTLALRAGGGTDFYGCAERALAELLPLVQDSPHLPAIVIMTDGKSEGSIAGFQRAHDAAGGKVPVFGITFGDGVDRRQLDILAKLTGGRVFDGTKSLSDAFRAVRGYN
jgi:Ca-activated chloride channel family protein